MLDNATTEGGGNMLIFRLKWHRLDFKRLPLSWVMNEAQSRAENRSQRIWINVCNLCVVWWLLIEMVFCFFIWLQLMISGFFGIFLICCCRKPYPGMRRSCCVFAVRVQYIVSTCLSAHWLTYWVIFQLFQNLNDKFFIEISRNLFLSAKSQRFSIWLLHIPIIYQILKFWLLYSFRSLKF